LIYKYNDYYNETDQYHEDDVTIPVPSLKTGQQGHQLEFHQQHPGLSGGREGPHSKDGEIMGISWEFLGNCGDLLEVSGKI